MPKLTKEQIQFLKDNKEKYTNKQYAEMFNCDRHTISTWRKKLGISFSDLHDFSKFDQYIIENYNKKTSTALAKEIGCSKSYISKVWGTNGLKGKSCYQYYCNYNYFDKINTANKAYILGLISSDGCLYKREGHQGLWQISLKQDDKQILYDIKKELEAEHPIRMGKASSDTITAILSINSDQMYNNLLKTGLCQNKTWNIDLETMFKVIPFEYHSDFFRGYLDGDGTIYVKDSVTISRCNIKIALPLQSGKIFKRILKEHGINCSLIIDQRKKYTYPFGSLEFKNSTEKYCFLKWIYYHDGLSLSRKREKGESLIKRIEKNETNRAENKIAILKWGEMLENLK